MVGSARCSLGYQFCLFQHIQFCMMLWTSKMKKLQNLKFKKPSYHKGTLVLALTWNKSRQCKKKKKKSFAWERKCTSDFVRVQIFFLLFLFNFYFISWQHIYNSSRKVKFVVLDLRHSRLTSIFMMDQSVGDVNHVIDFPSRPIVCLTVTEPWITLIMGLGISLSILWIFTE